MVKKKSLFMQDHPVAPHLAEDTHPRKNRRRRKIFELLFKAIEALWMCLQMVQCFRELFKK